MHIENKADRLKAILQGYGRVAIAFSGGVDSSLLLKCALDSLGAGNLLVLFGKSELLKSNEVDRAENWPTSNGYTKGIELEIVQLQPLSWKEFVNNPGDRCYLCKLRVYTLFRERMEKRGFSVLIDGTNIDDLKGNRAGLRAIHELGVKMPLVEAGFDKAEVRRYSQHLGLADWNLPSSSCLATRIPAGTKITSDLLQTIKVWEEGVERFGLVGCRVRIERGREDAVYVEIRGGDFDALLNPSVRLALLRFFQNSGVKKVFLDLEGR
ncbi:MAG: ATP-dependent sacrificial sulfur transferase LarE [Desulfobulbaceae bacterium]|nr:ATP-dependent sacrificial sulfur transferase LarE [Desulfobulbaceae bacterium]